MSELTPENPREEIARRLQAAGITVTTPRLQIAELLFAREQHLSADQVLARLADTGSPVSKATVYNTLGLFAERGLVREVMIDASRVFYDSNTSDHYHFYNVDNGELTDFPRADAVIKDLPTPPPGTTTDRVDVVIRVRDSRR